MLSRFVSVPLVALSFVFSAVLGTSALAQDKSIVMASTTSTEVSSWWKLTTSTPWGPRRNVPAKPWRPWLSRCRTGSR